MAQRPIRLVDNHHHDDARIFHWRTGNKTAVEQVRSIPRLPPADVRGAGLPKDVPVFAPLLRGRAPDHHIAEHLPNLPGGLRINDLGKGLEARWFAARNDIALRIDRPLYEPRLDQSTIIRIN